MTLGAPNSGGQLDHIAPMAAAASAAATVSGAFGIYAATASPRPTPSARRPPAMAAVRSRNSSQVHSVAAPDSRTPTTATPLPARASACSA